MELSHDGLLQGRLSQPRAHLGTDLLARCNQGRRIIGHGWHHVGAVGSAIDENGGFGGRQCLLVHAQPVPRVDAAVHEQDAGACGLVAAIVVVGELDASLDRVLGDTKRVSAEVDVGGKSLESREGALRALIARLVVPKLRARLPSPLADAHTRGLGVHSLQQCMRIAMSERNNRPPNKRTVLNRPTFESA